MSNPFAHIILWVLAAVVASITAGFFIGRATQGSDRKMSRRERKATLDALVELVNTVEGLTRDMGARNTEMREVGLKVGSLAASGELEAIRLTLLSHVTAVIESNQKLGDDLQYARCRMEQQAEELDRTRQEANTDALSGVANRKAFDDRLRLLMGQFKREAEPFSLILSDLDHFKWINDTHGHQAGDHVLTQLGVLLQKYVRAGDFVARYGGDEFAVLMPRTDLETALQVASRLRAEVTRNGFDVGIRSEQTAITASLGVGTVRGGDTIELLFERVDKALYDSKHRGRNQVQSQAADDSDPPPAADAITETAAAETGEALTCEPELAARGLD